MFTNNPKEEYAFNFQWFTESCNSQCAMLITLRCRLHRCSNQDKLMTVTMTHSINRTTKTHNRNTNTPAHTPPHTTHATHTHTQPHTTTTHHHTTHKTHPPTHSTPPHPTLNAKRRHQQGAPLRSPAACIIVVLSCRMTMTLTTLFEDGSNMCWASGPLGMSDGVMNPRKFFGNLVRC